MSQMQDMRHGTEEFRGKDDWLFRSPFAHSIVIYDTVKTMPCRCGVSAVNIFVP